MAGLSLLEAHARHGAGGSGGAMASVGALAAPAVSALDMLEAPRPDAARLRTGWEALDEGLLGGGVRRAHVSEVCGRSGSGKTQLCMSLAAHTAMDAATRGTDGAGPAVIYVDATNAFRASCVAELVAAAGAPALVAAGGGHGARDDGSAALEDLVRRAMEAVEVHRPRDVWETFSTLQSISSRLSRALEQRAGAQPHGPEGGDRPVLLVVDSVPRVLSPTYASTGSGGNAANGGGNGNHHQQAMMANNHVWGQGLAVQLGTMLKAMAHAFAMAVVVRAADRAHLLVGQCPTHGRASTHAHAVGCA